MLLHLLKKRGIKKVLEQIKGLDKDVVIRDYDSFVSVESYSLSSLVRRSAITDKLELLIWQRSDSQNDTKIPARYIEAVL